jgi:beta-lactamase superfamily II metal-dependent hydrolase
MNDTAVLKSQSNNHSVVIKASYRWYGGTKVLFETSEEEEEEEEKKKMKIKKKNR